MNNPGAAQTPQDSGVLSRLSAVLDAVSALFKSRIELAALEMAEMRAALSEMLVFGAVAMLGVWFALIFWSALLVVLAWPLLGWKILLILAMVFSVVGIVGLLRMRNLLSRLDFLPSTRAEVRKDFDILLK
jgi:uncharacterized membrane protein YqjE